jgi:hypothetical protein
MSGFPGKYPANPGLQPGIGSGQQEEKYDQQKVIGFSEYNFYGNADIFDPGEYRAGNPGIIKLEIPEINSRNCQQNYSCCDDDQVAYQQG